MRGFFLSTVYFVLLIVVLYGISQVAGSVNVPPHEDPPLHIGDVGAVQMSKSTASRICTVNINTFGDLSVLDRPEVIGC